VIVKNVDLPTTPEKMPLHYLVKSRTHSSDDDGMCIVSWKISQLCCGCLVRKVECRPSDNITYQVFRLTTFCMREFTLPVIVAAICMLFFAKLSQDLTYQ